MAQLVALPQLLQDLALLHAAVFQLLLQFVVRLHGLQKRIVAGAAVAAVLVTLLLQRQFGLGQILQPLPQLYHTGVLLLQRRLMARHIGQRLLVGLPVLLHPPVALSAVGYHIRLQAPQVLHATQNAVLLRAQCRLIGLLVADGLGQLVGLLRQIGLAGQLVPHLLPQRGRAVLCRSDVRLYPGHAPAAVRLPAVQAGQLLLHSLAAQAQALQQEVIVVLPSL